MGGRELREERPGGRQLGWLRGKENMALTASVRGLVFKMSVEFLWKTDRTC